MALPRGLSALSVNSRVENHVLPLVRALIQKRKELRDSVVDDFYKCQGLRSVNLAAVSLLLLLTKGWRLPSSAGINGKHTQILNLTIVD